MSSTPFDRREPRVPCCHRGSRSRSSVAVDEYSLEIRGIEIRGIIGFEDS